MKWEGLLSIVSTEPVFSSGLLMSGNVSPETIQKQLTRWVKAGKLIQLRRGLYALAEPHRKVSPHPFLMANRLKWASYVSLQSALAYHGTIPEYVPVVTSVTTGRPGMMNTTLGNFLFKHIKKPLFSGYLELEVEKGQKAFVATPEKSLLDLVYLTPQADRWEYLEELRLQNLNVLSKKTLIRTAANSGSAKLQRATKLILRLIESQQQS